MDVLDAPTKPRDADRSNAGHVKAELARECLISLVEVVVPFQSEPRAKYCQSRLTGAQTNLVFVVALVMAYCRKVEGARALACVAGPTTGPLAPRCVALRARRSIAVQATNRLSGT